jgi:hypothetical protein
MHTLLETTYQNKKHTFLKYVTGACLFMMQREKAKLMFCFVNDYCIPTTLFKTISKLNNKNYIIIFIQTEFCKL